MPAPAKTQAPEPEIVDHRPPWLREPWGLEIVCEEAGRPETRVVLARRGAREAQGDFVPQVGALVFPGVGPPRRALLVEEDQEKRVVRVYVPRRPGDELPA